MRREKSCGFLGGGVLSMGVLVLSMGVLACGGPGDEDGLLGPLGNGEAGVTPEVIEGTIEGPSFSGGNWVPGECGEDLFLDVASYAGPGSDYPMPEMSVTCTATTRVVTSNGIPHYTYQAMTPNGLSAQNFTWEVPLTPTDAAGVATIPCLGTVGFSINGIPIYGPNEGPFPDPYGDPIANDVMDWCQGHTGGAADYHYHGLSEECMNLADGSGASPVLGFALDGYPIYGPRGCVDEDCTEVVTFLSGWDSNNVEKEGCTSNTDCGDTYTCASTMIGGVATQACVFKDYAWAHHSYSEKEGVEFLDECNGRVGPDGTYRYHTTSTFPYILGCYRGEAAASATAMGAGTCPTQ